MRRSIIALLTALLWALALCPPARAANRVGAMDIDVALRPDGSAAVAQVWTAEAEEGTEFYLACRDSGYLRITDFSVSDENGPYVLLEDWDVDASLADKAGRCGVVETEEGVELCWGIGGYGAHRYTITYVLHNLAGAYDDADGFHHRFVDETDLFPTDVTLTIRMEDGTPLTEENGGIWAFGYDGDIRFEDGIIRARSLSPLDSGQHMTVMASLEKGLLAPARREAGSFEEVKERALQDSDYQEESSLADFFLGVILLALAGGVIALVRAAAAACRRAGLRHRMARADYFRDAPNGGNLNMTHRLGAACGLCREDALLGAYLLRLVSDGALEPEETAASPRVNLRLVRPPRSGSPYDDAFYTVLEAAAGADGVLQAKELERYCDENSKPLAAFVTSCQQDAGRAMAGCSRRAACRGVRDLTSQGRRQLDEILGLKRFLLDFSLIHERGVRETVLWQDYLIYAHLLGIAEQVAPQLRSLYPDALPQVERLAGCIGCAGYYDRVLYSAYERQRQREEAERGAGRGGRASLGGGGGFSGGGGGGTR